MLNDAQREAVEHSDGPMLIFACAGSGKTTMMTHRVARLIRSGVKPSEILLVTFTKKAAAEMMERVVTLVGPSARGLVAGTFHAVCAKGLRKRAHHIHRTATFEIYTRDEQETILRQVIGDMNLDKKKIDPGDLAERISLVKQKDMQPADLPGDDEDERTFREIWANYEGWLTYGNALDFEDLILEMMRLAERDDEVGAELRGRFTHVLVDEFQDTNMSQYRLVRAFAANRNLCVVGDARQCHPPGVMVEVRDGQAVPVESLRDGMTVRGWNRNAQKMVAGRKVRVSKRPYKGQIIDVTVQDNKSVPVTPNHKVLARWTDRTSDVCVTYLMWRSGFGFRVGWCQLFTTKGVLHLSHRMRLEKADKVWILRVHSDRTDASVYESIVAARYGIATITFERILNATHQTTEAIRAVFDALNGCDIGGRRALLEHGREFELPFYPWPGTKVRPGSDGKANGGWRRATYFEVYASNLVPHLMRLPLPEGQNQWSTITSVTRRPYRGPVYSIDVEKDHSYAANGIVVKNSIYGWRGANRSIILGFRKDFPDVKVVKLEQNYRSSKHIVAAAGAVIAKAVEDEPLTMWTDNQMGPRVAVIECPDDRYEGRFIAERASKLTKRGVSPGQIAVLYRSHSVSRSIEDELRLMGVPYVVIGGHTFYERKEVKDVLAYLRLIHNRDSDVDLLRVINVPIRGIGPGTARKLRDIAKKKGTSMWAALESAVWSPDIRPKEREQLGRLKGTLEPIMQRVVELRPAEAAAEIIQTVRYKKMWEQETREAKTPKLREEAQERAANCDQVVESIAYYERRASDKGDVPTVRGYLDEVALLTDRDTADADAKMVLMTVHASKGLEFDYVFLPSFERDIFPHKNAFTPEEKEEERRLAYVAVTRARRQLWMTYCGRRMRYNQILACDPSEFVEDIPEEHSVRMSLYEYEQLERQMMNAVSADPQLTDG